MTGISSADQPLWRVMHLAQMQHADPLAECALQGYAAMIEAVRDRNAPDEPEPTYPRGTGLTLTQAYIRWQQRQEIRAELTAEAEKARRGE